MTRKDTLQKVLDGERANRVLLNRLVALVIDLKTRLDNCVPSGGGSDSTTPFDADSQVIADAIAASQSDDSNFMEDSITNNTPTA